VYARSGETRRCATCGAPFYVYPSRLKDTRHPARYCSYACRPSPLPGRRRTPEEKAHLSRVKTGRPNPRPSKPPVPRVCRGCGQLFTVPYKRRDKALFCDRACIDRYQREHPEEHPRYRDGRRQYDGPNWAAQSQLARERDGHTCQDCGLHRVAPALDVHHLTPRATFARDYERANRLENLVTLCRPCHGRREGILTRERLMRVD
jgi:5-methylcytosine-specific restriction endonuclease McrA